MNFAALNTEVGQMLSADAITRIPTWVNWAQDDFLSRARWSFLEVSPAAVALVASQQGYVLMGATPVLTDYAGLIDVMMELTASGARVKLKQMEPQDFDEFAATSRLNGVPVMYTVVGGVAPTAGAANILSGARQELLVWPIPIATAGNGVNLFIRYYRSTDGTHMSATTDVPIVPVAYHQALVFLAAATGLLAADQESEAQMMQAKAEAIIQKALVTDLALRTGDNTVYTLKPKTPHAPGDPRDQNPAGGSAQSE